MIVDSHCHLLHQNNEEDVSTLVKNANDHGVNKLLNISTKEDEFEKVINLSEEYDNIYCSIGVHPHETLSACESTYAKILELSKFSKVIGIGETGLDFYYNHSDKKSQISSFIKHIEISQETNLPIIIHMREAEDDVYKIINNQYKIKPFKGLIHCFTGSSEIVKKLLPYNFYFSLSGIITFKNSTNLRNSVKSIPISNMLVETDSPYLAPEPMRGKTNQPSNIIHTVEYIANMLNVSVKELSDKTTHNFFNLFNKAK
tara:strand:+ start:314 stop:1087 length:774 start_codon:yes stop_codon:yes gene_type:complete